MKITILDIGGKQSSKKELPIQFEEEIRPDLVRKAFLAIRTHDRQPYGANPKAGKRASAKLSRRRRDYKGSYGLGISRVPRKILSRRGMRFNWVGAFAPGTVGGRRAHPPKAEKIWRHKINKKERRKAIRSALASSIAPDLVSKRGHRVPKEYPIAVESKAESIEKTKDVFKMMLAIGLKEEIKRTEKTKTRSGKGKIRGRRYKKKKGPLIVVSKDCPLKKTAKNIHGIEIVEADKLNCKLLAPGGHPGRLTIFTEASLDRLEKEKLFLDNR